MRRFKRCLENNNILKYIGLKRAQINGLEYYRMIYNHYLVANKRGYATYSMFEDGAMVAARLYCEKVLNISDEFLTFLEEGWSK